MRRQGLVLQLYDTVWKDLSWVLDNMDDTLFVHSLDLSGVKLVRNVCWRTSLGFEDFTGSKHHFAEDEAIAVHQRDRWHFGKVNTSPKHHCLLAGLVGGVLLHRHGVHHEVGGKDAVET